MAVTFEKYNGPKFRITKNGTAIFVCTACDEEHSIAVREVAGLKRPVWQFNEDIDSPTVSPSVRVRGVYYQKEGHEDGSPRVCHSFIKDGHIQYLNDCTHGFAGQTIELPEIKQ